MPMAEPSTIGTSADLIAARPFHRPQVGHPIRELWLDPAGYLACRVGSEAPSHSEDRVRQCEGDKQRQPMQHAVRAAWLDSSAPSLEWGKIRSQQASRPKKSGAPLVATRNLAAFVRTKFRRGGRYVANKRENASGPLASAGSPSPRSLPPATWPPRSSPKQHERVPAEWSGHAAHRLPAQDGRRRRPRGHRHLRARRRGAARPADRVRPRHAV